MRFQDWDVLLFPAGKDKASHIPLQEFRTACYIEQPNNGAHYPTPLLTTFVPSLAHSASFQISVHSWSQTHPVLSPSALDGAKPRELWQVAIVVDGTKVCVKKFDVDVQWPQVIASSTTSVTGQAQDDLKFPPFHRVLMGQNHWDASDLLGRIRIELSSGYIDPKSTHRFVPLHNIITFAFQPAPMDLLEQTAIAWPNPRMYLNPIQANPYYKAAPSTKHHHNSSINGGAGLSSTAWTGCETSPGMPANPTHGVNMSSRSSSAYSDLEMSAAPLLSKAMPAPAPVFTDSFSEGMRKDQSVQFRLPSDQIQRIIDALSPKVQVQSTLPGQHADAASKVMPPPPVPAHMPVEGWVKSSEKEGLSFTTAIHQHIDPVVFQSRGGREESHHSDISMHAGCAEYPSCISEDAEGRITHHPPATPSANVKGRKEGSSPVKVARDFFSTILDSTAAAEMVKQPVMSAPTTTPAKDSVTASSSPFPSEGQAPYRKRTRSALKALDPNNESPEKKGLKPPRKASRTLAASDKKGRLSSGDGTDEQENMIIDV